MEFFREKLEYKVSQFCKLKGYTIPKIPSDVFENLTLGKYRIYYNPFLDDQGIYINISKIKPIDDEYIINNGNYFFKKSNLYLSSSEFIEFTEKDFRDFKLKKLGIK